VVNAAFVEDTTNDWMEHVSDEQYQAASDME
jgi:hypothetical protein